MFTFFMIMAAIGTQFTAKKNGEMHPSQPFIRAAFLIAAIYCGYKAFQ